MPDHISIDIDLIEQNEKKLTQNKSLSKSPNTSPLRIRIPTPKVKVKEQISLLQLLYYIFCCVSIENASD